MARYSCKFNGTASSSLDHGYAINASSNPRRQKWYEIWFGSTATPADVAFLLEVQKRTAAGGTPVAVTPQPLDDGDTIAATTVASNQPASNGAGSGIKLSIPLNGRATVRWFAVPGSELVVPATASQGLALATPTMTAQTINSTVMLEEL